MTSCRRPQTVPACYDFRKTVLYIGQLLVRILNLMLFFRGIKHTIVAAITGRLDIEIRHKHNQLVIHLIMEKSKN